MTGPIEQVRELPFAPALCEGQSAESYIEALSLLHGVSVSAMLTHLRISVAQRTHSLLNLDGIAVAQLSRTCRVPIAAVEAATLQYYREIGCAPSLQSGTTRSRAGAAMHRREAGSRFCPSCLTEDPTCWYLTWHLSWTFACLKHNCLLLDQCPDCSLVPRSGENRCGQRLNPWHCQRRRPGGTRANPKICGRDLRTATAIKLRPDSPILHAQAWIADLLGRPTAPAPISLRLCGLDVPRGEAIEALSFLVRQMSVLAIDVEQAVVQNLGSPLKLCEHPPSVTVQRTSQQRLAAIDADAYTFATMATIAVDCLSAPSLIHAAADLERYRDLRRTTDQASDADNLGSGTWRQPAAARSQSRRRSGLVDAIDLAGQATDMTPTEHMAFRTQNPIPRRPRLPGVATEPWPQFLTRHPDLGAANIPQVLWSTVMKQLPSPTHKDTGAREIVAAMTLVRIGTFQRWAPIALQLSLPATLARTPNAVLSRLVEANMFEETLYVLDGLHQWLENEPPPIDYGRRRHLFAHILDPGEHWRTACLDAGVIPTERRRRFLGHALFELLTGSDARCRQSNPIPSGEQRVAYKTFRSLEFGKLDDYLHSQAERLLAENGIAEPVTWEPGFDPDEGWYGNNEAKATRKATLTESGQGTSAARDLINAIATTGQHDSILTDLVAYARDRPIVCGPGSELTDPGLYARTGDRWSLGPAGVTALGHLAYTFGPTVDLSLWDHQASASFDVVASPLVELA